MNDYDPEIGLLGCICWGNAETTAEIMATVDPAGFTNVHLIETWEVLRTIEKDGRPVDMVEIGRLWGTIHNGAKPPMIAFSEALDQVPSAANWPRYAEDIATAHRRRELIAAAQSIANDPDNAAPVIERIQHAEPASKHPPRRSSKDVARMLIDDIEVRSRLGGRLAGISYGIDRIDRMTEGLQPGEYVIVGARPSIGKTALGVTLLANIAVQNEVPCLFITCETNELGIHRRLLANVSGLGLGTLKSGRFDGEDGRRAFTNSARVAKAPIWYRNGMGWMDGHAAAREIRNAARAHGIKVVFIDYLQRLKIDGKAEKRTYAIAENSEAIKTAADQAGVAVIAMAQLNREAEDDDTPPSLRSLADCGQIERDADTVILIHRKRTEAIGRGALIIAKARDGETGIVPVDYHGPTVRFTESIEKLE